MNKISTLLRFLDSFSAFSLQESWDNCGLLLGSENREFNNIYLSLEATKENLENMDENSVLITHHPLIFSPLKNLNFDSYPANLLEIALKKNISLIAIHTNFDKTHFGEFVVKEILRIPHFSQDDFIMNFAWDSSFEALCKHCKNSFNARILKATKAKEECKNIALVTGSGASFIKNLKNIDCLITGDVKYHDAMEALSVGISLIDCGHYELESYFGKILLPFLTNVGYKAIILPSQNPFIFI
ncbi:MAG: Nif3-like dinuclear metal center hexameric protein [Helicobacter sp.]|nr:Nif3-like dinuclear metal center hexameric protein [Helicobacteraceae bacterium]MDY3113682.1 Nif3-like dinuclear metal center hexameric protein [Helicobacter sp.]